MSYTRRQFSIETLSQYDKTGEKITIGGFSLTILWVNFQDEKEWFGTFTEAGIWLIWTFIVNILGIVIFWIAIISAMRTSDITKAITEPIYSFWNQVWSMVAKSPQYLPIFGGQSMESMKSAASNVASGIQSEQAQSWTKFAQKNFGLLMWDEKSKELQVLATKSIATSKQAIEHIWKVFEKVDSTQDIFNNHYAKNALINWLKKLASDQKVDQSLVDDVENANTPKDMKEALSKVNNKLTPWFKIFDEAYVSWWQVDNKIKTNSINSTNKDELKINIKLNFSADAKNATIDLWKGARPVDIENGKVQNLKGNEDELAKYIFDNKYTNENIGELLDNDLLLSENAKNQLNGYFWKDNNDKIVFWKKGADWSNLKIWPHQIYKIFLSRTLLKRKKLL